MIRTSSTMVSLCVIVAVALHAAGAWVSEARTEIEIEGGAGATETVLGSSFADMVAGAAEPTPNRPLTPRRQPERVVKATTPSEAPRPESEETPRTPLEPPSHDPAEPDTAARPALSEASLPKLEIADAAQSVVPEDSSVIPVETVARAAPKEVVVSTPEPQAGQQVSRRPRARPLEIEQIAARPSQEPERQTQVQRKSGNNATRDARRGSASGTETATAARAGRDTRSQSTEQGNAAVSNYPGMIMRHLSRVPRPRADRRGEALVEFTIADGGRLAAVRVVRSSGSSHLDRAALAMVQRASPFPAPPRGAKRSFSVQIKGQ